MSSKIYVIHDDVSEPISLDLDFQFWDADELAEFNNRMKQYKQEPAWKRFDLKEFSVLPDGVVGLAEGRLVKIAGARGPRGWYVPGPQLLLVRHPWPNEPADLSTAFVGHFDRLARTFQGDTFAPSFGEVQMMAQGSSSLRIVVNYGFSVPEEEE